MISFAALSDALRKQELLDAIDLRLVAWLCDRAHATDPEDTAALAGVASALCRACAEGSLCLPLQEEELGGVLRDLFSAAGIGDDASARAAAARFLAALGAGRLDAVAGTPDAPQPLLRAHDRLYLHRFWFAEKTVAEGLSTLLRASPPAPSRDVLDGILRETLETSPLRTADGSALALAERQREALVTALREPVFVLSGGPGTGKTTWTAAWLRAVLRLPPPELSSQGGGSLPGVAPDRVRLCAPTGRAARRLEESLRTALSGVQEDPRDAAARALPVTTLHALLGWRAFEGRFARGPEDPIDADWILLDEASMADVFLMAALVRALRPGARLVLAGDPDQLPAVEAGPVLGELLPEDGASPGPVPSVTLETSHRARGAALRLAAAVRAGESAPVLGVLGNQVAADALFEADRPVARSEPGEDTKADITLKKVLAAYAKSMFESPRDGVRAYGELLHRFRALSREDEPEALEALWNLAGRARILSPLRRGPVSAERANRLLRERLEPAWKLPGDARAGAGFHGAPILVTRNDARTGLSNGDLGLWLESAEGAAAYFPRPELPGGWLRLPVALLPACEPGFATTVHKSQGSECDEVLILLPEPGNRLLARETLYTAITRARAAVRIFGTEDAIREAISRKMKRYGGLRGILTPPPMS